MPLADAREGSVDLAEKAARETVMLFVVPSRGIVEIGLGEWPNDEPAGQRCLLPAIELLAETVLNDLPLSPAFGSASRSFNRSSMLSRCQSANGHSLCGRRDS